ncbi:hypothetical protein ACT3SZ_08510 [Corynebacterium sp. AOP40-9SA-29]|uniref:hypothetical protein n=1 Tax=Corynebacterium sp. AOP40-9SA-29 TaxID=3457677 RepID=UPI004033E2E1
MGNNDWGAPASGGNPWTQEDLGTGNTGNTGNTGRSGGAGGLATGIIVAAIVAVVLVVGLIAAGMLMWNNSSDDASGDDGSSPHFTAVPESDGPSGDSEDTATTETTEATETTESQASPSSPDPSTRSTPSSPSTPSTTNTPSNLSSQGWRGVTDASCKSSDQWVYAGTNGDDYAVICRVGERGGLYYRGYYNDQAAEYDIDMDRVSSGRWVTNTLDRNGSRVELTASGVRVIDGSGKELSSRDFTWSSEDDR